MVDVTLNLGSGPDQPTLVAVKLQTPTWEVNIWATPQELAGLSAIRETDWNARRCLHIGVSAGAPVHWSAEGDTTTIMIGHDTETWDIAIMIPTTTVDQILAETAAENW